MLSGFYSIIITFRKIIKFYFDTVCRFLCIIVVTGTSTDKGNSVRSRLSPIFSFIAQNVCITFLKLIL